MLIKKKYKIKGGYFKGFDEDFEITLEFPDEELPENFDIIAFDDNGKSRWITMTREFLENKDKVSIIK
jgi:hypothetical protein